MGSGFLSIPKLKDYVNPFILISFNSSNMHVIITNRYFLCVSLSNSSVQIFLLISRVTKLFAVQDHGKTYRASHRLGDESEKDQVPGTYLFHNRDWALLSFTIKHAVVEGFDSLSSINQSVCGPPEGCCGRFF